MSLKIGVIYPVPFGSDCALDPVCSRRGYFVDVTRLACQWLHYNCTFLWYNGTDYGDADENGTGTGIIGAIQNGEFDTSIPDYTPTYRRSKSVAFTDIYEVNDLILMTRAPAAIQRSSNWSLIKAFHWPVWLCYFISLLLTILVISLFQKKLVRRSSTLSTRLNSIYDHSIWLIMNEYSFLFLPFHSARLAIASWSLAALVLTSAYTGVLFTRTMSLERDLPYRNMLEFVECLESFKCRMISPWVPIPYLGELNSFGDRLTARIERNLKLNPVLEVLDQYKIHDGILKETEKYLVVIGPENILTSWIDGNVGCKFYTLKLDYTEVNGFPVAKNAVSLLRSLNKVVLNFKELGIDKVLYRKYVKENHCTELWNDNVPSQSTTIKAQGLSSVATTFYFYFAGIIAAMMAFGLECCWESITTWVNQLWSDAGNISIKF